MPAIRGSPRRCAGMKNHLVVVPALALLAGGVASAADAPRGAFKRSGNGLEGGREAILEFCNVQSVFGGQ